MWYFIGQYRQKIIGKSGSIEKKIRGWGWIAQNGGGGVSIEGRGVKPFAHNVLIFSKDK